MMFFSEEVWSCIIAWVAFIIYNLAAFSERDPVFGSVLIWSMSAILMENINNTPVNMYLIGNAIAIVVLQVLTMSGLTSFLIFEELQPWYEPLSFYNHGTIGKTDWSQMFSDFD